jgi:hypothetical protein
MQGNLAEDRSGKVTIFYPDISNYQAGLIIQPGTVAVCAKASEGTGYRDPTYSGFQSQAAARGVFFFAYHWLHHGNVDAQANFCHGIVGGTPVMIDCEGSDKPTVSECVAFANALRARGGVCSLTYLPHWYWQDYLGSPSLTPLTNAGLSLVSSSYTAYSDSGPGWNPYGGVAPVIWQFSSNYPYGGKNVDFNAYRGTAVQLTALVSGKLSPSTSSEETMPHLDLELNKAQVLTSPTVVGGSGWVCLSSDFGSAQVRVALKHNGGGWDIHDNLTVNPSSDHVVVAKVDPSVTKISAVVQSISTGNTCVGLDVLPDHGF